MSSSEDPSIDAVASDEFVSVSDFRPVAIVSGAFVVIATFLVIRSANNYIELADQSLYLLMIDSPEAAIRSASGYHVLIAPLFSLVGKSVIGLRILRAVLDIGVDIALGISLVRYLRSRENSQLFESNVVAFSVVSTITLGGFAAWIYAVNGFGYDQIGAIVFTALAAVVLWIVGGKRLASKDAMLAVLGGALFSMALIVRWTAALAAVGFIVWVLIDHLGVKKTLNLLGAGFVGALGALAVIHVAIIDVTVLGGGIRNGTADVSRDSHSVGLLLSRYVEWLYLGITDSIGLILASVFVFALVKRRHVIPGAVFVALLVAGFVMAMIQIVLQLPQFVEANAFGTSLALTCSALVLTRAIMNWKSAETKQLTHGLAVPVMLTALPALVAGGSFLPLFLTALPVTTLWVAALWVLLPSLGAGRMRTAGMVVGAVLLSSMPWLLWQSLERPARTEFAETPVLVEQGRFEGIFVDSTTQQLLHDLEDLRLQVDPNPTVLSFWGRPVVPFALEGTGLGFPWYSVQNAPNAAAVSISGACLDDGDTPTGDVVLVTEQSDPREFGPIRGALRDCGIDFPVDFELLTTVVAPDYPDDVELSVYLRDADR